MLSQSYVEFDESSAYGSYWNSILTTAEIYAPIADCQGRWDVGPVGRSKSVPPEIIGQRKCPRQLFGRSVTEAGWQQAERVSEDGFWRDLWVV